MAFKTLHDSTAGSNALASVLNAYFPTYANEIATKIHALYDYYYIPYDEDEVLPSGMDFAARWTRDLNVFSMQYPNLEKAETAFRALAVSNFDEIVTTYGGTDTASVTFDALNSANEGLKDHQTTQHGQTITQKLKDGRTKFDAALDDFSKPSPIVKFVNAIACLFSKDEYLLDHGVIYPVFVTVEDLAAYATRSYAEEVADDAKEVAIDYTDTALANVRQVVSTAEIVVDNTTAGQTKLFLHNDISNKIARALLLPLTPVVGEKLVAINSSGQVLKTSISQSFVSGLDARFAGLEERVYISPTEIGEDYCVAVHWEDGSWYLIKQSDIGGGGGSTPALYQHNIEVYDEETGNDVASFVWYSTRSTPFTLDTLIPEVWARASTGGVGRRVVLGGTYYFWDENYNCVLSGIKATDIDGHIQMYFFPNEYEEEERRVGGILSDYVSPNIFGS